jgi:hypothetical protein
MSDLTAHELLVRARNRLAERGVCAWRWTDNDGRRCARGAIFDVAGVLDGRRPKCFEPAVPNALVAIGALINANEIELPKPKEHARYDDNPYTNLANAVAFWSNALVDIGKPEAVIDGFDKAIAATAPEPDVSFVTEPVAVA